LRGKIYNFALKNRINWGERFEGGDKKDRKILEEGGDGKCDK
jgi:hypothetical protein